MQRNAQTILKLLMLECFPIPYEQFQVYQPPWLQWTCILFLQSSTHLRDCCLMPPKKGECSKALQQLGLIKLKKLRHCRPNHRMLSPGMACVSYFQASSKEPSSHGCFHPGSLFLFARGEKKQQ